MVVDGDGLQIRVVPVLHSCGLLWAFTHAPAIRLAVAVAPGETNPSSDALSGVPFWLVSTRVSRGDSTVLYCLTLLCLEVVVLYCIV